MQKKENIDYIIAIAFLVYLFTFVAIDYMLMRHAFNKESIEFKPSYSNQIKTS